MTELKHLIFMLQTSLHCASVLLLVFFTASIHCQLFYERTGEISYNRLHPSDTSEIQQCLSPDLEETEKSQCRFFAAVIDAGSTGTRLHLFEFSHDTAKEHSVFKLEAETYKEVKPGVSCFAKTPELAAENVRELLLVARKQIPENIWEKTAMTFKATAGVRLLTEKEADGILSEVENEILSSGFLVDDDAVGVLSGIDEGVFGWFTLNFLLGRLDDALNKRGKGAAALDLGGGSSQVTFVPDDFGAAMKGVSRQKYSHRLKIFDKELRLYTHSYLGNGLVASRLGIAKLTTPEWTPNAAPTLRTHCLPKKFVLDDWDYAGNVWLVGATKEASFENCMETTKQYVTNLTDVKKVPALLNEDIYLFGYFYDRGVQGNVVEYTLDQIGGEAVVGDYKVAAQQACEIPAEAVGPEHWLPWQCLDLAYIYTLLHHGYGLPDNKTIHLTKKVRSMEVSWALGAGFHLLNSYHQNNLSEHKERKQRELQAALERDRKELEQRRKAVEEKEAAAERKMAYLMGADDLFGQGKEARRNMLMSALLRLFNWISDATTYLLSALNLIS